MITIRSIKPEDNTAIAGLIRKVFREFKIDRPGTVYTDPTTDHLYELFRTPASCYWLAEEGITLAGGCGIYPTPGLPERCAELVKLYVSPEYRGQGIGLKLMEKCVESAREMGYRQLYLETLPELSKAVGMYEKAGFKFLPAPLGNSGHFNCSIWMIKEV